MLLGQLSLLGFIIFSFLFIMSLIKSDGKGIRNFIITAIFSIIFLIAVIPNYINNDSGSNNVGIIPKPNVYEGHGDDKIEIENVDDGPLILYIKGNKESSYLSIDGYNINNKPTNDFWFSNEPHEGLVLFNKSEIYSPPETTSLKVISEDAWEIETRSLRSLETIKSPGEVKGTGPDVFLIDGNVNKATIQGNKDKSISHPALHVEGYTFPTNKDRNKRFQILHTTENSYKGTVKVDDYLSALSIRSDDSWTIKLE